MDKNEVLKILETAKDENDEVPMRLVRQAFEKLPEPCEDTISRQAAIDAFDTQRWKRINIPISKEIRNAAKDTIKALPPAQPEMNMDEWCTDCKEYDHEKHCCPRWNRVIRQTLKDAQQKPLKYSGESICLFCRTANCNGCLYEPTEEV